MKLLDLFILEEMKRYNWYLKRNQIFMSNLVTVVVQQMAAQDYHKNMILRHLSTI